MTYDEVIEAATDIIAAEFEPFYTEGMARSIGDELTRAVAPLLMEYGARLMQEAAAKAASTAGSRPVGGGDGSTYTSGTSQDAAHAIRVLDPATIVKDASNG